MIKPHVETHRKMKGKMITFEIGEIEIYYAYPICVHFETPVLFPRGSVVMEMAHLPIT